jgi:hypothetical protein
MTSPASGDEAPRSDLDNTHDVPWSEVEVVSDHQVRVHFIGGDPECYGYNATVSESSSTIVIRVTEGTIPDAPQACLAIGRPATLLVDLSSPVAGREILPGEVDSE